MAVRYEKIEKTKNSKSFLGYKTKENQLKLKSLGYLSFPARRRE